MKNITLLAILSIVLLSSCAVNELEVQKTTRSVINYDNSNPVVLEKAVAGLDLLSILPEPSTLGGGTIAVRSIEADIDNHLDEGVIYMIEDNIITILINAGYNVVERDPDALGNLFRESSLKFKKENPKYDSLNFVDNLNKLVGNNKEARGSIVEKNSMQEYIETELNSATYILSYRVLECGVVFNEIYNNPSKVNRSSRTRLHCRLTDTKSSKIYAAGLVENEYKDIVYTRDIKNLKQISYKYYDHTLPLQTNDENVSKLVKVHRGTTQIIPDETPENMDETKKERKYSFIKYLSVPIIMFLFGSE